MKINTFVLPPSFAELTEGIELPKGCDILRVDADTSDGRLKIIALFDESAPMIRRQLFATDIGGDVPDEYLPRLVFLGTFHVFGFFERMYGFGPARSFALFIEREEPFWSRNPADVLFDLMKDNPRVDRASLSAFCGEARAYFNEPVPAPYAGDDEPREREVLYPVGEPSRSRDEIRNAVRETMREQEGDGDA